MSAARVARSLFSHTALEWRDLMRAQGAILSAAWRRRKVKIGDLIASRATDLKMADPPSAGSEVRKSRPPIAPRAQELATALSRAARFGLIRPECLVRSIALQDLLMKGGIADSIIRVGVRKDAGGFEAHAWVELHGRVVGDDEKMVSRFVRLENLDFRATR